MRLRRGDLLRARVRPDDGFETLCQIERGLAAAASAVPRAAARGSDLRQQIEERARISRTELRVLGREARKVVLERHGFKFSALSCSDYEPDSQVPTVSGTPRRSQNPEPRSTKTPRQLTPVPLCGAAADLRRVGTTLLASSLPSPSSSVP